MEHRFPATVAWIARASRLAAVGALLTVGACGGDDEPLVLTADRSGSEVEVGAGEEFEVRLESNPSTGYAWQVSETTDPAIVTLTSATYVEGDATDPERVGASGTEVFVFRAGTEGAGVLRLEYARSFDDPIVPERVVEFVIRIDGAAWPPPSGSAPATSSATVPG